MFFEKENEEKEKKEKKGIREKEKQEKNQKNENGGRQSANPAPIKQRGPGVPAPLVIFLHRLLSPSG